MCISIAVEIVIPEEHREIESPDQKWGISAASPEFGNVIIYGKDSQNFERARAVQPEQHAQCEHRSEWNERMSCIRSAPRALNVYALRHEEERHETDERGQVAPECTAVLRVAVVLRRQYQRARQRNAQRAPLRAQESTPGLVGAGTIGSSDATLRCSAGVPASARTHAC